MSYVIEAVLPLDKTASGAPRSNPDQPGALQPGYRRLLVRVTKDMGRWRKGDYQLIDEKL